MTEQELWRRHECLPRRDSSRSLSNAVTRSTTDSLRRAGPNQLSPGFPRCNSQSISIRFRHAPNGRKTQLAKTPHRQRMRFASLADAPFRDCNNREGGAFGKSSKCVIRHYLPGPKIVVTE